MCVCVCDDASVSGCEVKKASASHIHSSPGTRSCISLKARCIICVVMTKCPSVQHAYSLYTASVR